MDGVKEQRQGHDQREQASGTTRSSSARILVVANQTVDHPHLHDLLRERAQRGPTRFHLLVPASRQQTLGGALIGSENLRTAPGENPGYVMARYRMTRAMQALEEAGLQVTGDIGPPDPRQAVAAYLSGTAVDEIVVCTLPRGMSRWLRRDLPRQVRALTDVPVHHVEIPVRG